MKLLLELSMECEPLARTEAFAAASVLDGRPKVVLEEPGILVIETSADPRRLGARLGLCHYVSEYLGSCRGSEIEKLSCEIEVEGPIRVRSTKVGVSSVDLSSSSRKVGAIVGETRGVDLHNPKTDLRLVYSKNVHFGSLQSVIDRSSFEKRKNRYMPFVYPASLHPKFARALVNMSEVSEGGRLLDPFCGTGAILAEASLAGAEAIGTDFSKKMIDGARRNLSHLKLTAEMHVCDVGDIRDVIGHIDGIATDPPYGRATTTEGEDIPSLYSRAFAAFGEVLVTGAKAAIVVPDVKLIKLAKGFRLKKAIALRVHRSLTRNFCMLERI